MIIYLAGLLNFLQSGLITLKYKQFHGDPLPVNIILLVTVFLIGSMFVVYVYRKSRDMERDYLENEAEHAVEQPIPDVATANGALAADGNGSA